MHDPQFERLWAEVSAELEPALTEFVARLPGCVSRELRQSVHDKGAAGWDEHGGDIVDMSEEQLLEEFMSEVRDGLFYLARRRVLRRRRGAL